MQRRFVQQTYAAAAAALASMSFACTRATPEVTENRLVPGGLPKLSASAPGRSAKALTPVSASSSASNDAQEPCVAWRTVEDVYDPATGDFRKVIVCDEGGAIASIETVGHDDGAGNGTSATTYQLRDGSSVVWDYRYEMANDGMTQLVHGTSSEGDALEGAYAATSSGGTSANEVWTRAAGTYFIDGVYEADGRFNGTEVFDDPNTAANPDWVLVQSQGSDGVLVQSVDGVNDSWLYGYTLTVAADGSSDYDFVYDDLSTQNQADFAGSYHNNADGSGQGGYRQQFDDGSILDVGDVFDGLGNLEEGWAFDDAQTALPVDVEGLVRYAPDGSGEGSVTTHFENGPDEVCQVHVAADGSTTIDQCQ